MFDPDKHSKKINAPKKSLKIIEIYENMTLIHNRLWHALIPGSVDQGGFVVLIVRLFVSAFRVQIVTLATIIAWTIMILNKSFGVLISSKELREGSIKFQAAPGTSANRILEFLFSKNAMDEVFSQVIGDMRDDIFDALQNGEMIKAKWINVRDHIWLTVTVAAYVCVTIGKKLNTIWKVIP